MHVNHRKQGGLKAVSPSVCFVFGCSEVGWMTSTHGSERRKERTQDRLRLGDFASYVRSEVPQQPGDASKNSTFRPNPDAVTLFRANLDPAAPFQESGLEKHDLPRWNLANG